MKEAPAHFANSEFYGQMTVHPIGLAALIILGFAMLLAPRKYALWPLILMACFISPAQRLVFFGLNFPFIRIMVLFASVRIFSRKEYTGIRLGWLDLVVMLYAIASTTIYTLQFQTAQAFIFKCGANYDVLGVYFTFRFLVRSWEDIQGLVLGFVLASIPVAAAFLVEYSTRRNLFAFLGGVPEVTQMREGRLRCQGAFAHAILAGCFWAAVLPLITALSFDHRRNRLICLTGMGCCLLLIVLSASSTPLMALIFSVFAAFLFPLRHYMAQLRWALVATLCGLHMVMNGPVWSLVTKINLVSGSTGYHRFLLFDQAIKRFDEWWLLGTKDTAHWGWGLFDVTNQFVLEGVRGGVLSLILFIGIVALTFRNVGRLLRVSEHDRDRWKLFLSWALGAMMFVHVMNFFAVSYFGQMTMMLWLTVGTIASLADHAVNSAKQPRTVRVVRLVTTAA